MAENGLESALDEQRMHLFTAAAMVDTVAAALIGKFGAGWPAGIPEYPLVLQQARKLIDDAADALERQVLEERAVALAHESGQATHG